MTERGAPRHPVRIDRVVVRISGMTEADARAVASATVERLAIGPGPLPEAAVGSRMDFSQSRIPVVLGTTPDALATQAANVVWRGVRDRSD